MREREENRSQFFKTETNFFSCGILEPDILRIKRSLYKQKQVNMDLSVLMINSGVSEVKNVNVSRLFKIPIFHPVIESTYD